MTVSIENRCTDEVDKRLVVLIGRIQKEQEVVIGNYK